MTVPKLSRHAAAYLLRALLPSLHLRTRMRTRPSRPSPHPPSSDPSRLHGVDRGDELVDDGGVGERGGVAELVGLLARDLAQHAPHHLTRARLGQPRDDHDAVEDGEPANLLAHRHLERGHEVGGLGDALGQDDVRKDALALDVVRGERRLDP